MATTTDLQGLPVPEGADDPDVAGDITALAEAIEKRLFCVYENVADRDARNTSPQEGQIGYLKDTNRVYCYIDGLWTQIYPQVLPAITSGTAAPNNSTGSNGDIYFQV